MIWLMIASAASIGSLAQPAIEQIARNTTAVWNHLAELKTAMPGAVAAAESKEAIDNKPPRVKVRFVIIDSNKPSGEISSD